MTASRQVGVLLINLGTPDSPSVPDVRRYLREFLSDPRVIDIAAPMRWLLLNAVILPFRPAKSAKAYQAIWSEQGSPLLHYGRALSGAVAQELGDGFVVELGMRYGRPAIGAALQRLVERDVTHLVALPLFPQHAAASTGSALENLYSLASQRWTVPELSTVGEFFDHPGFIDGFATVIRRTLESFDAEHVLFSYHGLPERQIKRHDDSGAHCLVKSDCCDTIGSVNRHCYRAQCYATTRSLAARLGLTAERHSTSFQSRLGRTPWIKPYTDIWLDELAQKGTKRIAVVCPAFVADCLETLEEIGIRAEERWRELGGEKLVLVPSLNVEPVWVKAVADMVRQHA